MGAPSRVARLARHLSFAFSQAPPCPRSPRTHARLRGLRRCLAVDVCPPGSPRNSAQRHARPRRVAHKPAKPPPLTCAPRSPSPPGGLRASPPRSVRIIVLRPYMARRLGFASIGPGREDAGLAPLCACGPPGALGEFAPGRTAHNTRRTHLVSVCLECAPSTESAPSLWPPAAPLGLGALLGTRTFYAGCIAIGPRGMTLSTRCVLVCGELCGCRRLWQPIWVLGTRNWTDESDRCALSLARCVPDAGSCKYSAEPPGLLMRGL